MTTIPLTRAHAIREGARALKQAGIPDGARDARLLLAHVQGVDVGRLIAHDDDIIHRKDADRYTEALSRRAAGEPVSRIRGWREFYGRRFEISPDTLDPRPDTETLVDVAVERIPEAGRILDLGTGTGCVLISVLAETPEASGVGVDLSSGALEVARRNGAALGVRERVEWVEGSWDAAEGSFDVVVSNPPYIRRDVIPGLAAEVRAFDPALALDGGEDGLDAVRSILAAAPGYLRTGGWLALEVGFDQTKAVMEMAAAGGWREISRRADLGGNYRVVSARRPDR